VDAEILTIENVAQAKQEIAKVGASPVSINIMAAKAVFKVIKVTGVSATAANILKQEMLSKGGEAAVHAGAVNCKQAVSDVILMGTLNQYRRVIKSLRIQPLGLRTLAEQLTNLLSEEKE
jgi:dihydropteroate synthase